MKTLKERIEIEQAYEDGKKVDWMTYNGGWHELGVINKDKTIFDWKYNDYRIKPEPLEFFLSFYDAGHIGVTTTMAGSPANIKTIKVREVTE